MEITLQEAYNILSAFGFGICMYKIHKLETILKIMQTNQLLNSMASLSIVKALKQKNVIEDKDLDVEIRQEIG
jgi:hypothetical protein